MHDIIRFAHEAGLREMFLASCRNSSSRGALRLVSELPLDVFVLDVNDAIDESGKDISDGYVRMDQILSCPMRALWNGLVCKDISWENFEHFDWKSFDSVAMAGGMASRTSSAFASYAVISRDYLNFNMKFGYHFTIVDSLCSDDGMSNYINMRFAGGGGTYSGRKLRLLFLEKILNTMDFSVSVMADLVDARFQHGSRDVIMEKLEFLGRLFGVTRLMDMALRSEQDVSRCVDAFLAEDYGFVVSI